MSCVLNISGESLDIDALLSEHAFDFDHVWKKGEPRILKGKFCPTSGANVLVSNAEIDDFDQQVADATEFLEKYGAVIAKIASFPGVEFAGLDFGVALNEGYVAQCSYLPPEFIRIAATSGISVEISHYACSAENAEE